MKRESSQAARTAEEIYRRGIDDQYGTEAFMANLFTCRRCGRDLGRPEIGRHHHRMLTLQLPPEEGRVKPKEYGYFICQWCVTEFLEFMQEKRGE